MLKKIFSYGFIEGIAKGLNKLTILALPLFLDTISFGKIGLLVSIELVVPVISLLGFERAVLRFYSEKNKFLNFNKTVFSSVFWVHLCIIILFVGLYLLGVKTIFGLHVFPDLFLVLLLIYFQGTNLITLNILRVEESHKKYFHGRLFIQITKFILVILCVYLTKSYLGYLAGAIIAAIAANILFRIREENSAKESFNKNTFSSLFVFSWPFIFHGLSGNLLGNADKFILEMHMSLRDVGIYTLAYSIGSTMIFAYVGITVFLEPLIYKEKSKKNRDIILNKFVFFSVLFGTIFYILITFTSRYILPQIYEKSYNDIIEYIPLIAIAFLVYPFYLRSNYEMIYEKKALRIALTSIATASVNILLNIYFIPKYGIKAAIFVTIISYLVQALLFIFVANNFKINDTLIKAIVLESILIFSIILELDSYYLVGLLILYLILLFFHNSRNYSEFIIKGGIKT